MCAEWIPAFAGMTRSLRRRVAVVGVALDSIYITDRIRMNDAAIIATVRQYFSRRAQNVVTAYVFGSVGKGLSGLSSDVDIAVLYARRAHFDFPPCVKLDLIWQIAESWITQNFLPFQYQGLGRCDVSHNRQTLVKHANKNTPIVRQRPRLIRR